MRSLTPRHLWQLATHSVGEFFADNCTQMAAAISYYVLFSLFPLMILGIGITGLVIQDTDLQRELIDFLQENLPVDQGGENDIADEISDIATTGSSALGLFGALGMLWAGSGMFAVIRRSLNRAWDLEGKRPFVRQKLVDFTMMLVLGVLFLLSLTATGFLRIARQASDDIPVVGPLAESAGWGWGLASFLIPVAVSGIAFFLLYWLVPATHVRKRHAAVGALIASPLFEVAKLAFAIYIENFGNYNAVYGSIGTVVIFLFWVFISANIMLFGAEVASEYPRVLRGDYDQHIPTAASLTPWHVRLRRGAKAAMRGLVFHDTPKEKETS